MDNSKTNIGLFPQMPVCNEILHADVSSDFTLPDYKSEIRKLISTKVKILPPKEYIGNNGASLEGELIYKVLYIGADSSLYSATLTDKYKFDATFQFDSHALNTDDICLNYFCECENVSTRVQGPRKLTVKSKILCKVLALSPSLYTPELVGTHNKSSIENQIMECPALLSRKCESEPITLTDMISIDSQIDNIRIIDTSSSVMIQECSAGLDKINIRGDVLLKILYCNDAQSDNALTMTKKLPFSTSILCEGVNNSFESSAKGVILEENVNVNENSIDIELIMVICAYAQKNEEIPYISDAFSTERSVTDTYEDISIIQALKTFNSNLSHNDIFTLTEIRLDPDAKIIDCDTKARIHSLNFDNGKLILLGECNYQVIYYLNGEHSVSELTSPLRYETDLRFTNSKQEIKSLDTLTNIVFSRARSDGEHLFIDCELNFCISVLCKDKINLLKEVLFYDKLVKEKGTMTLCYPNNSATLWSIAKQYGEPIEKIRVKNSLSENHDISKKKFLVI